MKIVDNRPNTKVKFSKLDYKAVFTLRDTVYIRIFDRTVKPDAMSSGYVNALNLITGDTSCINDDTVVEHCATAVLMLDDGKA